MTACLFIFYEYLLDNYQVIFLILTKSQRSFLLHIIFTILVQSNNVDFIIKNHSNIIKSISEKLRHNIKLEFEPANDKSLIKIADKLKGYNN